MDDGKIYAIVTVFIAFIVTTAVVIPIVINLANPADEMDPNADARVGDTFTYTPAVNIPDAIISVSGSALDYGRYTDGTIEIKWEEAGDFDLTITAVTSRPNQSAVQTVSFHIAENTDTQTDYILYVVPTVLIVGIMLYALRRVGGMDTEALGDMKVGGNVDFLDGNTRGFGKR